MTFIFKAMGQDYCDYKYDNNWLFGYDKDSVNHYGGSLITFLPQFQCTYYHYHSGQNATSVILSSRGGDFLFYSNGCDVFDRRDSLMENGENINPGEFHNVFCTESDGFPGLQNIIVLPLDSDTNEYYLIYINEEFNQDQSSSNLLVFNQILYSSIDIKLNMGYGSIFNKNMNIVSDTGLLGMPMDAVRHSNGLDWWIVTPERWTNAFNIIFVDNTGVHFNNIQYIGITPNPNAIGGQGKFSPIGKIFAWYHPRNGLFIYDFDRSTGKLSNFRKINIPGEPDLLSGALEFSPTGRYLYVADAITLYQLDMMADDIQGSLMHIADFDGFADPYPFYTNFYHMERTPDKRIFMNTGNGSRWLHVIQDPDSKGLDCDFEQRAIHLPTYNFHTLPHFPNYRLGAEGEPLCDSMIVSVPNEINKTDDFSFYPNPASNVIYLQTSIPFDRKDVMLVAFNLFGYEVAHSNGTSLDISGLSQGYYWISLKLKGKIVGQKGIVKI